MCIPNYFYTCISTWTIAACSLTPLNPIAIEAADIIIGPLKKRIAIPIVAIFVPQAMILGCRAMNKPAFDQTSIYFKNILT